ncbi:MAG: hypothetical protein ITD40_02330, partial [Nitrosarchaeum sp.]|nr:hypothetical protein [Nitrosarchaeum sp.]
EGTVENVVREAKSILTTGGGFTANGIGQINLVDDGIWPFVQLYNLSNGGNVIVQYNKGGGVQTTTLKFDESDAFAKVSLDQAKYTQSAQVHATITDAWLNIDPTDEDSWTFATNVNAAVDATTTFGSRYQVTNEQGSAKADTTGASAVLTPAILSTLMQIEAGTLAINGAANGQTSILQIDDTSDNIITATASLAAARTGGALLATSQPVTVVETGPNTGVFGTYDELDDSTLETTSSAARGTSATIDYNGAQSLVIGNSFATIAINADSEWKSGQEIPVIIVDADQNKNSRSDETLSVNSAIALIPTLKTGDPFTLGDSGSRTDAMFTTAVAGTDGVLGTTSLITSMLDNSTATYTSGWITDSFSLRGIFTNSTVSEVTTNNALLIQNVTTIDELKKSIGDTRTSATTRLHGINLLNIDMSGFATGTVDVYMTNTTAANFLAVGSTAQAPILIKLANDVKPKSITSLNGSALLMHELYGLADAAQTGSAPISFLIISSATFTAPTSTAVALDFFSFGYTDDGVESSERVSNQIIRIEAEESDDNTATFEGSLEYVMINQLNILTESTFTALSPIDNSATFIAIEDLTDEDSPRVNYLDLGSDGVSTQIADQQASPSHSGIVSFNTDNYKVADTVTITLEDLDLNVDTDLIEIYTTVSTSTDANFELIGKAGLPTGLSFGDLGRLLDVTFDDSNWLTHTLCATNTSADTSLLDSGFTLVETGVSSGVFVGDFQIPATYCPSSTATAAVSTTGVDIAVDYVDYRDASGEIIEVGDSAGVRANTGSVSLDRTVYPVPFGIQSNFASDSTTSSPSGRALFPVHQTAQADTTLSTGDVIANGDLTIHVRVNDADFNISAAGEDKINTNATSTNVSIGPVKISVLRGSSAVILGYAGGPSVLKGTIDTNNSVLNSTRQFGPMNEIAPDAGIFESDIVIRYTDGPASTLCPATAGTAGFTNILNTGTGVAVTDRFDVTMATSGTNYCILQGDILQVEYTDSTDASGDTNTVTDSATFDLRNGVLQSDKSVYIIGSDIILTLIEPDFDLDNDQAETYDLDLIEWDSDAATTTLGGKSGTVSYDVTQFDAEPSNFRETGDSTGIFQVVIEMPATLTNSNTGLDRGEEADLQYTDWAPSGSDYVGDEDQDVNLTIFTSNFGATVELDQKVYTWTDKVYLTIVAPDHNMDSSLIDSIGETTSDAIKVATRAAKISQYKLVETGPDTGIFTGEVILAGFQFDADGDSSTGDSLGNDVTTTSASATGSGPTNGSLPTSEDDGLTVSFEFNEDETVVGSALIRWNVGEVQWLEASYPASGTGVVRVIDPDMNLDPEAVDNFAANIWSDSDAGGIDLTVTETNEATGIFEGTVFFTVSDSSAGSRLRVAEGDTVTAEYEDNTLPNPYTTADELNVTATSLIGTVVPPLERAPAANLRTVDAFGNSLSTVAVDQQVQLTADLSNGQDREQQFAYLVQIQDGNGVTVSLAWITGSLSNGQSFSPALSWIPTEAGTYTATAFVWESIDNPTALSPPVSTTITVQ